MQIKFTQTNLPLLGTLKWNNALIGLMLLIFGSSVLAADPGPYVPNLMIARQVSEADVFGEAMEKGVSEGVLIGATAKQLQLQLRVNTPVRMRVIKGDVDAAGCQVMYTSMAVTGIHVPNISQNLIDYIFTNKLTLCKDKNSPMVDVTQCEFGGKSCMPNGLQKTK